MHFKRKSHRKNLSDFQTVSGIDLGATKTHVLDSHGQLFRYVSAEYSNLNEILDRYFAETQYQPAHITIAAAGPRNDATGAVRITNLNWPAFEPKEAEKRYSGITFHTTHDVSAAVAAIAYSKNVTTLPLKVGKAQDKSPIIGVTISSGVGVSCAIWDEDTSKYIFFAGEAGHMGFQPSNEAEYRMLRHIATKFEFPSIELAISGKHGVLHWLEQSPELQEAPELEMALASAIDRNQPPGAVLLAYATEGNGAPKLAATTILNDMGRLVGSILADFALSYRATGGIYLTGSVSMGLSEYWAKEHVLQNSFIRKGVDGHAPWLEEMLEGIPISLITDPSVAASGALAIAEQQVYSGK